MSAWRRLWRILRVFLLGTVGILGAVVLTLVLLLATTWGRALVVSLALSVTNGILPGRVELGELESLDLSGIEIRRAQIFDPQGTEVVRVEQLRASWSLSEVIRGRFVVHEVELEEGHVDLRGMSEPERGLLSAFIDPNAPESPPSTTPPPYVRVEKVRLRRLNVSLEELPSLGAILVRDLSLDGEFELDQTPSARVSPLRFRVERAGQRLGELESLELDWKRGVEPSSLQLALVLSEMRLGLRAEFASPLEGDWQERPVKAELDLSSVSAPRLAVLLSDPSLSEAFQGEAALGVQVSGTPQNLSVAVDLTSSAGVLQLEAKAKDQKKLEATLRSSSLQLRALRADLPPEPLRFRLELGADVTQPGAIPWTLRLDEAIWGEQELPRLRGSGRVDLPQGGSGQISDLDVQIEDGSSEVRVEGSAGFDASLDLRVNADVKTPTLRRALTLAGVKEQVDGRIQTELRVERTSEGRLATKGHVSVRNLRYGEEQIQSADANVYLEGTPPALRGEVNARVAHARLGGQAIQEVDLRLRGGPQNYDLDLTAIAEKWSVKSELGIEQKGGDFLVSGLTHGQFEDKSWAVQIAPTRLSPAESALETEGLVIQGVGQKLTLKGKASARDLHLDLDAQEIDFSALSQLLRLPEPLLGHAHLSGKLRGSPEIPELHLKAELERVSWGARPPVSGALGVDFSAREGSLETELQVKAAEVHEKGVAPFAVSLRGKHSFSGGAKWQTSLLEGELSVDLDLQRLETEFLEAWLPETELPVLGVAEAKIRARGSLREPRVQADLGGDFRLRGSPEQLRASVHIGFTAARLSLDTQIQDERGAWVELTAGAELPTSDDASSAFPWLAALQELPTQGRWSLEGQVRERELASLPFLSEARDLPPAAVSARWWFSGEPELEPEGELRAELRQTGTVRAWGACEGQDLRMNLEALLKAAQLRASLVGTSQGRQLFESGAELELGLLPLLQGGELVLGPIRAHLESERLRLEQLPFVCDRLRGELSARAELQDPLGRDPSLSLNVELTQFGYTRGSLHRTKIPSEREKREESSKAGALVDVRLSTQLGQKSAEMKLELVSGTDRSRLSARVPLSWSEGKLSVEENAPLDGKLQLVHLPIAPFLDPRGSISYASGTLSGRVGVQGTLGSPELRGDLRMENLAFTATELAQPLRAVNGRLLFSERSISIEGFEARDRDGSIQLDGRIELEKLEKVDAQLRLVAKKFPLRQQGQVVATADVATSVGTLVQKDRTDVKILLESADLWIENADFRSGISLDAHPDFVIDGAKGEKTASEESEAAGEEEEKAQEGTPERVTHLTLETAERFWVKRDDFAVNLSAAIDTEIRGGEARVKGNVLIERGYLMLLGKTFDLERGGTLNFVGATTPDPVIDLTATHNNRRTGRVIQVHITGRGSSPEIAFFVDDKKTEVGEAFLAIYGSERTNARPQGAEQQAAGFVGGLTAGLLATSARRELGAAAPIIMIEPGDRTGEGRVRAGFELDSLVPEFLRNVITGVYFEGIVANESNSSSKKQDSQVQYGVLLEFYYPKNFFSTGQYGPGATWSLDLGWQL